MKSHEIIRELSGQKHYEIFYYECPEDSLLDTEALWISKLKPSLNLRLNTDRAWNSGAYDYTANSYIMKDRQKVKRISLNEIQEVIID